MIHAKKALSRGNNSHIAQPEPQLTKTEKQHIIEAKLKQIMRSITAFKLSATA